MGFLGEFMNTISPLTYSEELELIFELEPYPDIYDTDAIRKLIIKI